MRIESKRFSSENDQGRPAVRSMEGKFAQRSKEEITASIENMKVVIADDIKTVEDARRRLHEYSTGTGFADGMDKAEREEKLPTYKTIVDLTMKELKDNQDRLERLQNESGSSS